MIHLANRRDNSYSVILKVRAKLKSNRPRTPRSKGRHLARRYDLLLAKDHIGRCWEGSTCRAWDWSSNCPAWVHSQEQVKGNLLLSKASAHSRDNREALYQRLSPIQTSRSCQSLRKNVFEHVWRRPTLQTKHYLGRRIKVSPSQILNCLGNSSTSCCLSSSWIQSRCPYLTTQIVPPRPSTTRFWIG
jgi:hypothetical protein